MNGIESPLFNQAREALIRTHQSDTQVNDLLRRMMLDSTIYGEALSNGRLHAVENAFHLGAHLAGFAAVPLTDQQLMRFAKERTLLGTLSDQQLMANIFKDSDATGEHYLRFINAYPSIFRKELETVNAQ